MIIHRGMGILAPIIFAIVYFLFYWIFKIFSTPHWDHGWFLYVGAIIAGIATWRAGVDINKEVYEAQKINPYEGILPTPCFFYRWNFGPSRSLVV